MVSNYTIKFGPAVSQKELEKVLHQPAGISSDEYADKLTKMKARIEMICDFADLRKIGDVLKELSKK